MALTPEQAAGVARRHGLSLQDAAGLLSLADDEESAERIAAQFVTGEGAVRAFVRDLFKPADDPPLPAIFGQHGRAEGTVR